MNLLALLAASLTIGSVKDCSNGASQFKLTSMSFQPDPPVKGQNSTLLLSMNVPTEVQGGTAKYSATYNFIPFSPTTEDLCVAVPGGCPIIPGQLNTVSSYPIDPSLSGTLVMTIEWKDTASVQLLCVSVTMKL